MYCYSLLVHMHKDGTACLPWSWKWCMAVLPVIDPMGACGSILESISKESVHGKVTDGTPSELSISTHGDSMQGNWGTLHRAHPLSWRPSKMRSASTATQATKGTGMLPAPREFHSSHRLGPSSSMACPAYGAM